MEPKPYKKFKSFFKALFKRFDYFGVDLKFQIDNDSSYQSVFGGIAYSFFMIFSIVIFSINFKEFVGRNNLKSTFTEEILDSAPPINFTDSKVPLAFGYRFSTNLTVEEFLTYIRVSVNFVELVKLSNNTIRSKSTINFTKCTPDLFYNYNDTQYHILQLDSYFCMDLNKTEIKGIYTEQEFHYYEITTELKSNLNEEQISKIKKIFNDNSINLEIFYADTSFSIYNYKNPKTKFINSYFVKLSWEFYKALNMDFIYLNFFSDDNILLNIDNEEKSVIPYNLQEYNEFAGSNRENKRLTNLSKIFIRSSNRLITIKRVYQKVTEFIADTSSILSLTLISLYFIIHEVNNFKARKSIVKRFLQNKQKITNKGISNLEFFKRIAEKKSNNKSKNKFNLNYKSYRHK